MEFLATIDWAVIAQIIMIDILLGGDNAVVIALACRNLHPNQRRKGIMWGTAGAIILRVALVAFAVTLLQIPFLKFTGGILLLWIEHGFLCISFRASLIAKLSSCYTGTQEEDRRQKASCHRQKASCQEGHHRQEGCNKEDRHCQETRSQEGHEKGCSRQEIHYQEDCQEISILSSSFLLV